MTWDEIVIDAIAFFDTNDEAFIETIEDLDGYNGCLGDDRIDPMEYINELYTSDPLEALTRAFYGYDGDSEYTDDDGTTHREAFNPNKKFFYYSGYGNLVSTDYKDYSDKLDEDFIQALYDHMNDINLPEEIVDLFNQLDSEEPEIPDTGIEPEFGE